MMGDVDHCSEVTTEGSAAPISWLEDRMTLGGTLTATEKMRRRIAFAVSALGMTVSFVGLVMSKRFGVAQVGAVVSFIWGFVMVVAGLCRVPYSVQVLRAVVVLQCIVSFGFDYHARSYSATLWPLQVIVIDMILVLRLGQRFALGVVVAVLLWVFLFAFEDLFRFGLLDVPFLTLPAEDRRDRAYDRTNCDTLPCKREAQYVLEDLLTIAVVFVADFLVTRSFAAQVVTEQSAMQRTIATVREASHMLAMYDIDMVQDMLRRRKGELPPEIHGALTRIEANLRMYKPYLPAALFEAEEETPTNLASALLAAPTTEEIAIVFTDIRSSTPLWEASPQVMAEAMKVHNAVVRAAMATYEGYEAKTIGDAFMIAFAEAGSAIAFGVSVQERLHNAAWPDRLLEMLNYPETDPLWRGLTVRIGMNTGPVDSEPNHITRRVDYLGHTVNVAARLEAACPPGSVSMLTEVWENHRTSYEGIAVVSSAPVKKVLKGIQDSVNVTSLWPRSLEGRRYRRLQSVQYFMESHLDVREDSLSLLRQMRESNATIGVINFFIKGEHLGVRLSSCLENLFPVLGVSGGGVVALLGNRVCVGWNLSRTAHSHAESALRFFQRTQSLTRQAAVCAGVATGPVHHGSVGNTTRRFFTVVGDAMLESWRLCDEISEEPGLVVYAPEPCGEQIPPSLRDYLLPGKAKGVFTVVPFD